MKAFTVWDKTDNTFCKLASWYNMLTVGESVYVRKNHDDAVHKIEKELEEDEYEIFTAIELEDIDGKSIYADCSIVDMEYFDYRYKSNIKAIGYFTENKEKHCLEFVAEDKKVINFIEHIAVISNIKIIDTIQENKLGLIK